MLGSQSRAVWQRCNIEATEESLWELIVASNLEPRDCIVVMLLTYKPGCLVCLVCSFAMKRGWLLRGLHIYHVEGNTCLFAGRLKWA